MSDSHHISPPHPSCFLSTSEWLTRHLVYPTLAHPSCSLSTSEWLTPHLVYPTLAHPSCSLSTSEWLTPHLVYPTLAHPSCSLSTSEWLTPHLVYPTLAHPSCSLSTSEWLTPHLVYPTPIMLPVNKWVTHTTSSLPHTHHASCQQVSDSPNISPTPHPSCSLSTSEWVSPGTVTPAVSWIYK